MNQREERWQKAVLAALRAAKPSPTPGRQARIALALEAALGTAPRPAPQRWRPALLKPALAFAGLGLLLLVSLPARQRPAPQQAAVVASDPAWEGLGESGDLGPCSLASDCG